MIKVDKEIKCPPEAYDLLSKSMEENKKLLEELRNQYEQGTNKETKLEARLEEARKKSQDPNLTQEERDYWKEQEPLIINELRKQRQGNEDLLNRIRKIEQSQTEIITKGTKVTSDSISGANLGNIAENFKPSFTTKLIIAGAVILLVYLMVVKK